MNEMWKTVEDYPAYEVSTNGDIRNKKTGRILSSCGGEGNYQMVCLSITDNKNKTPYVHRLVAKAFIPNPDNLTEVNHKDEDKLNNSVDNLEWCTRQYNLTYGTRIERISNKKRKRVSYIIELKTGFTFRSVNQAALFFETSPYKISYSIDHGKEVEGLVFKKVYKDL